MRRADAIQVRGVRELALGQARDVADQNVVTCWKMIYLAALPPVDARVCIHDGLTPLGLVLTVEDVRPCELALGLDPDPKADWDIVPAWEVAFAREYDSTLAAAVKLGWQRVLPFKPALPPKPPPPTRRKDP